MAGKCDECPVLVQVSPMDAYERNVTGRKPDPRIEGYIHYVGLILLLGLMAVILFNDVTRILRR